MGRRPKSTAAQNKRNANLLAYNQHMLALVQAQALANSHAHSHAHNPVYINPHTTPLPAVCSPPLPDASDNTFSSLTNSTIYPPQWSASLARAARHHSAPFLKENVSLTSLEGLAVAALVNGTFIPTSSKTNPAVPPPHPAHSQRPSANIPILSISRIVNPSLEQSFETRRRDLLRRKSRSHRVLKACGMSDEDIAARLQSDYEFDDAMKRTAPLPEYSDNPALLFHCTKSNVDDILRQGLDQRLGAGGLLGRGLYFADAVGKSLSYDQNSTILVFSVILGDCVFVPGGNQTYVREPPKADCQKRNKDDLFFDSIVGRPAAHNEYVIYRSDQCLPLYAISYSRGQPLAPVVYPLPPFTWNSPNTPLSPPISTHPWPHSPVYVFDAMIDPYLPTPKPANSPSKLIASLASSSTSASSTTPVRPRPPRKQVSKTTPSPKKPASYKVGSTTVFLDFDDDDDDDLPAPTGSRFTKPNQSSSARTKLGPWTCTGCSFINDFDRAACELCRVARYPAGSSGKTDGEGEVVVLDGAKSDDCSPRDFTGKVESLVRMGFLNQRKNRKAVFEAHGDIEKAVAILRAEEAQGQMSSEKDKGVVLTVTIEDDVEVVSGKENEAKKDDSCSKRKANAVVDIDDDIGVVSTVGSGASSSSTRVPTPQKRRAFFKSRLAAYSSSDCLLISSDHDEPIVVDLTGPYKPNQAGPLEEENQLEESAITEPSAPVLTVQPEPEEIDCDICTGSFKESEFTRLQCNHSLCNTCFSQISISGTTMAGVRQDFIKCPWCKHTQGVEIGDCPNGTMSLTYMKGALHGHQHDSTQTIVIDYIVGHPTHLQTHRRAFLPDNVEGRDVLRRLQIAWDRRLVLRVGTSATSGLSNVLVWNLHHKTSVHGGVAAYGYPDETYLQRVGEELRERGVL
ncbi:E3 ubiquitin-protein ligase dtx3l [Chytriomyces hyalinus]|nr:E3 ubiquitin-protein ligase dtx3l [Chytriomyces hyalinus]